MPENSQDQPSGLDKIRGGADRIVSKQVTHPAVSVAPRDTTASVAAIRQDLQAERGRNSLDSLNFRQRLPIDLAALAEMSKLVNSLKQNDSQFSLENLLDLIPQREASIGLPLVASVIAHVDNPDFPIIAPTTADIHKMKPWLRRVSTAIGKFSRNGRKKFDKFVEKEATYIINKTAEKTIKAIEAVGNIASPREQFVIEIAQLYGYLSYATYSQEEGFFGDVTHTLVPIEDKIAQMLGLLETVRDAGNHALFTRERYPLLTSLLPLLRIPTNDMLEKAETIGIAGVEIMSGIQMFLNHEPGYSPAPPVPKKKDFDFFDMDSWMRELAEWFAPEKLANVQRALPYILWYARAALPASGADFKRDCYQYAQDITAAKLQGKSDEVIAQAVFTK